MDTIYNYLITSTLKSGFFKSRVLAWVRGAGLSLGTYLVTNGFADKNTANLLVGLLVSAASFYLQDLDVKVVDGKIKIALNTPVPVPPVEVKELPPIQEAQK